MPRKGEASTVHGPEARLRSGAVPSVPDDLDTLLSPPPRSASEDKGSSEPQQPVSDGRPERQEPPTPVEAPEPLVQLPPAAYDDLRAPQGAFSDDPPEGWGTGQGNVAAPDPVTSQLDPVAAARQSLLEDAARARGGNAPPPEPTTAVAAPRAGNRAPDIRRALALAAALPNTTKWRSRVTIGAAWQYDGRLHLAPDWVDRNWAAWDDGPAIEVPDVGLVRKGQWIVVQQVENEDGTLAHEDLKVYDDTTFRSLFMADGEQETANAADNAPA